jgi:uncharacterized protein YbcV (DUF1398 family)
MLFPTSAQCGIAKCRIDIIEMTCTYLSNEGDAIVIEKFRLFFNSN